MRDLGDFDEASSDGPKNEESGVFEALEKIGREGDEEGGNRKEHIESDRGRGAAFGESQKVGEFGRGRREVGDDQRFRGRGADQRGREFQDDSGGGTQEV
jgi:hypothetical protein